jgi:membrane-bound inhibitor of C-type lysozyme
LVQGKSYACIEPATLFTKIRGIAMRALIMLAIAVVLLPASAAAQRFVSYQCGDGTQFTAAFYEGSVGLQVDGRSLLLPQRISASGIRYRKSDVTLTVKGDAVTLRRGGYRVACTGLQWMPSRLLREPEAE